MTVYYLNGSAQVGQTGTGVGQTIPMQNQISGGFVNPPTQSFMAVVTGTGSVSATIQPQGSNDGASWINIGSGITIASGASPQIGTEISNVTYQYYRSNVTALTGTNASVTTTMAV